MKKMTGLVLAGFIVFLSFVPVQVQAAVQGGTAMYSAARDRNFYAGDVYVHYTYGVNLDRAYVDLSANDYCDFSVKATAYDWWEIPHALQGGADQTTAYSISCKNSTFDQMKIIQGTVWAAGPESGTSVYVDHDFTGDFFS